MDCIFCKIAKGDISAAKIWEDSEHIAILDINPNTKGVTLVMPKEHMPSYVLDDSVAIGKYTKLMHVARHVAKVLEKGLNVERVAMVMEGTGINHAHIKLIPLHGISKHDSSMEAEQRAFFERYPGYVTTLLGPQADFEELKKLAEEIRKKQR